jgi:uncharacterized protein (TIGR03905 family)
MQHTYKTQMVCSTEISFDLDGDVVTNIRFLGGCNGNLKALSKVLDGWTVQEINDKLAGNTCGRRPTSCADQLAKAVLEAYQEEN